MSLSKYQKFEAIRVSRKQIANAPYNPRQINPYNRKRLEAYIKKRGLISAITWNRRSGNIVGGHQRIAALDTLEQRDDYELDVNAVDLDHEAEVEANLALNSPGLQGDFDIDKFAEVIKSNNVNTDFVGFAKLDLEAMGIGEMFAPEAQAPQVQADMQAFAEMRPAPSGPTPQELAKQHRAEMKADHKTNEVADAETYLVIMCTKREDCEKLAVAIGAGAGDKYIDGRLLASKLEVTL